MPLPARFLLLALALSLALWPAPPLGADHPVEPGAALELTDEERQWLAEHPVLRMGVGRGLPPFQYVETEGGVPVFKGMASDYAALLEQRLGVHLEPALDVDLPQALELGRARKIDVFICSAISPERARFLLFTTPYLSYPVVIITRDDAPIITGVHDLQGRRVAVVQNLASSENFKAALGATALEIWPAPSSLDALLAVASGKVDACASNLAVASYLIRKNGLSNLRVAAPTSWERQELAVGVRSDWPLLAGVMQKAMDSISQKERDAISLRWISLAYDDGARLRRALHWALGLAAAAALCAAGVLLWNRRLAREVAERQRAEAELRASRKNYQDLFASMQTGFALHEIILDGQGQPADYRFLAVNPAFERLTGLDAAKIIGQTVLGVLPETERIWIERYGRVALTGEPETFEEFSAALDRHFEVVVYSPARGQFATLFSDVTERKRAVMMMMQSEKMLSLGGLAAGMAHEINNPLAGILQSAQNIARRLSPELEANAEAAQRCGLPMQAMQCYLEARGIGRMLDGIAASGTRAARIVASLLSFSRQEGTSRTPCDLAELVDETLALAENDYDLKNKHDFRNIRVLRDLPEDLPPLPCSRGQIEQVLLNLVRNAAHALSAMEPRRPDPTIRIAARAEGGQMVIEVQDNGPGLSEQAEKRIFEPFFTTKAPGQGTGLGLSVSYFIITRNHGGSFEVRSAPDQGARFVIRLPLAP
ncbi:ATP-binding protein [Desulfocurvus vexinensis]|uniref:ATP-binding protein n=1 Tax=Desulfocurvus vexinensis TaxID=399548 RepID=UPI0004B2D3D3|nr:transporter substrate-binding domain-containing protein [Desulfocurvus vexinensis]